ncbi:MAG: GIY-YIG nuclease family protein [Promethearchaeota archaeon]|jgi:putative endonuclease|nr:MAG: GIY-YIG nuclease family protein [Candidatus Lokiarchaeota archaeon]
MSVYYVYILETISKKNKKWYYTGYTNNLHRRVEEHKNGKGAKFCRGKKGIKLKYFETFRERTDAMRRELEIKALPRKEKIKLIKDFNDIDLIDA